MNKKSRPALNQKSSSVFLIVIIALLDYGCSDSGRNKKGDMSNGNNGASSYFGDQFINVEVKTLSGGSVSCMGGTTLCVQVGNFYNLSLRTAVDMVIFAFRFEKSSESNSLNNCILSLSEIKHIGTNELKSGLPEALLSNDGVPLRFHAPLASRRLYEEIYLVGLHPEYYRHWKASWPASDAPLINNLQRNVCSRLPGCDLAKDPPPIKDATGKSDGQVLRFQRVAILRTP